MFDASVDNRRQQKFLPECIVSSMRAAHYAGAEMQSLSGDLRRLENKRLPQTGQCEMKWQNTSCNKRAPSITMDAMHTTSEIPEKLAIAVGKILLRNFLVRMNPSKAAGAILASLGNFSTHAQFVVARFQSYNSDILERGCHQRAVDLARLTQNLLWLMPFGAKPIPNGQNLPTAMRFLAICFCCNGINRQAARWRKQKHRRDQQ